MEQYNCSFSTRFIKKINCKILFDDYLTKKIVRNMFICGLAGDMCINTAINAAHQGYNVYIITDLIELLVEPTGGYVNTPEQFCNKIKDLDNIKL